MILSYHNFVHFKRFSKYPNIQTFNLKNQKNPSEIPNHFIRITKIKQNTIFDKNTHFTESNYHLFLKTYIIINPICRQRVYRKRST